MFIEISKYGIANDTETRKLKVQHTTEVANSETLATQDSNKPGKS